MTPIKIKENLLTYAQKNLHIPAIGIASWPLPNDAIQHITSSEDCPFTPGTLAERLQGGTQLTNPQTAIVCLFPYYLPEPQETQPNLARYAWTKDYHLVVPHYLDRLGQHLQKFTPCHYEIHCDTSPLTDRYIAYLAGLGFFGKNHSLIHPTWGSYTNIGTLLVTTKLPADKPLDLSCGNCQSCIKACPGQALCNPELDYAHCKSYITQKKGVLADDEIAILRKTPLIWGCDVCQEICPYNKHVPTTPIPEFQDSLSQLTTNDLEGLTNRTFKEKYADRAFTWRGKSVLLRNLDIINKKVQM